MFETIVIGIPYLALSMLNVSKEILTIKRRFINYILYTSYKNCNYIVRKYNFHFHPFPEMNNN